MQSKKSPEKKEDYYVVAASVPGAYGYYNESEVAASVMFGAPGKTDQVLSVWTDELDYDEERESYVIDGYETTSSDTDSDTNSSIEPLVSAQHKRRRKLVKTQSKPTGIATIEQDGYDVTDALYKPASQNARASSSETTTSTNANGSAPTMLRPQTLDNGAYDVSVNHGDGSGSVDEEASQARAHAAIDDDGYVVGYNQSQVSTTETTGSGEESGLYGADDDARRLRCHHDQVGELYTRLVQIARHDALIPPTAMANLARNDASLIDRTHRLLDQIMIGRKVATAPFKSRFKMPPKIERSWNTEFQRCQRALKDEDDVGQNVDQLLRLRNLANDFVSVAEHYGRIIISERYLPNNEKTIRPVSVGGVAGGDKFVAQGILFKFAVDTPLRTKDGTTYMYGGESPNDENAMRVAGNELRGVISYFRSAPPGLHVPLMCLIDYRGFRLIAASLLPLAPNTICYGSNDGGATVHNSDKQMEQCMRVVASELNLKGHIVGDKRLHACGDIEGHKGTDGKYYAIDLARVFPPEAPTSGGSSRDIFVNLLRPELVKSNGLPLSSDAFSRFQVKDPRDKQLNGQVRLATRRLFEEVIPRWARNVKRPSHTRLVEDVHAAGINVRHLGRCRTCVSAMEQPELRLLLMNEMVARVVKNVIRSELRDSLRRNRVPSLANDRRIVLDVLNLVFSSHAYSQQFWCSMDTAVPFNGRRYNSIKYAVMRKFAYALTDEEQGMGVDLRWRIDLRRTMERLQQMTSITLSRRVWQELIEAGGAIRGGRPDGGFLLTDGDLVSIGVKVKHMNIVGLTTAVVLRLEATQQASSTDFQRLFKLAESAFISTLASVPDNALTWHEWGKLLYEKAKRTRSLDTYEEAIEKFRTAEELGAKADDQMRFYSVVLVDYALTVLLESRRLMVNIVRNETTVIDISDPNDWRESHRRFELVSNATRAVIKRMEDNAIEGLKRALNTCAPLVSLLLVHATKMYEEAVRYESRLDVHVPPELARAPPMSAPAHAYDVPSAVTSSAAVRTMASSAFSAEITESSSEVMRAPMPTDSTGDIYADSLQLATVQLRPASRNDVVSSNQVSVGAFDADSSMIIADEQLESTDKKSGLALLDALLSHVALLMRLCVDALRVMDDQGRLEEVQRFLALALARRGAILMEKMNLRRFQGCYDAIAKVAPMWEEAIINHPQLLERISPLIDETKAEDFLRFFCVYLSCPLLEGPVLRRCSELVELDMSFLSGVPEGAFLTLFRECQLLETLSLKECWQVGNSALEELAQNGSKRLRSLVLRGCHKIGDAGVIALASFHPQLIELDLSCCDRLTDVCLLKVADACKHLERLEVECSTGMHSLISDDGIIAVIESSTVTLKVLNISGCERVTDRAILCISKTATELVELRVAHTQLAQAIPARVVEVSEKALQQVVKRCAQLRVLDVRGIVSKRWVESKAQKYMDDEATIIFDTEEEETMKNSTTDVE